MAAEVEDSVELQEQYQTSPYSLQVVNSTKNEIHRETMPLKVVLDRMEDLLKKKSIQ